LPLPPRPPLRFFCAPPPPLAPLTPWEPLEPLAPPAAPPMRSPGGGSDTLTSTSACRGPPRERAAPARPAHARAIRRRASVRAGSGDSRGADRESVDERDVVGAAQVAGAAVHHAVQHVVEPLAEREHEPRLLGGHRDAQPVVHREQPVGALHEFAAAEEQDRERRDRRAVPDVYLGRLHPLVEHNVRRRPGGSGAVTPARRHEAGPPGFMRHGAHHSSPLSLALTEDGCTYASCQRVAERAVRTPRRARLGRSHVPVPPRPSLSA